MFLWMGPLLSWSGFSAEARSYVQMLAPSIPNMLGRQFGDIADLGVLKTLFPKENKTLTAALSRFIQGGSPAAVVCHSTPNQWFGGGYESLCDCPPEEGVRLKIGRAMFETDSLPPGWASQCNKMDEVWVPSQWNVETFANAGVNRSKLVVIPEAVDTETKFNPKMAGVPYPLPIPPPVSLNSPPYDALLEVFGLNEEPSVSPHWVEDTDSKAFKFLSIFKWHMRKGVDVLLQAYCEEFTEEDPVVLYMKTNRYIKMDPKTELRSMMRSISNSLKPGSRLPRIKLLDEWIADTRLPALYSAADAFVLPSRGEGWGLPQAEAMAMGLPTIITDWSGTTEFANKDTAILVNYTLREMDMKDMEDMYAGGSSQLQGHKFAEPSVADLRAKMRWVYEHPAEAKAIGAAAREHMRANFSLKAVAKIITDHLESTAPGVFRPGTDVHYEWSRRDVTSIPQTPAPAHSDLPGRVLANPYTWSKA